MAPPDDLDIGTLGTPENCVADFCLVPVCFSGCGPQVFPALIQAADWDTHGVSVTGGCRRSAFDAEGQFDVLDAFRRNDGG